MKMQIRLTALALLAAIGLAVVPAQEAHASAAGRRNTAIGLGALAVYGVATKKPLIAGLAGGGAVYSYMKSRESAKRERARRAARYRRTRYHRVVRHHYYRHR